MCQSEDRNRLTQLQLFIRVGRDRYIPINQPIPGEDLFMWDPVTQRIIPVSKLQGTS